MEPPALPSTIAQLPFFSGGRFPRPDLLGRAEASGIVPVSGRLLIDRVREFGLGLQSLGLNAGDRAALLAESRPEWLIADLGILASGAVTVPVYPTLPAEQVEYILRDSGAAMVIASTMEQLQKVVQIAPSLPSLKVAIVMVGDPAAAQTLATSSLGVHTMSQVSERGHQAIQQGWGIAKEFQDRAKAVRAEDLATIVYTSGTTGEPKGVMLTHRNLVSNIEGVVQIFKVDENDTALSFLPLCHSFERLVAYIFLARGVSMIFAESIDTIGRDIKVVRPTVMTGVPRVYEKLHARIQASGREGSAIKRMIFAWANRIADRRGDALVNRGSMPFWLGLQARLADKLVFHKIRAGVGGRFRFAVSGSAPLGEALGRWFYGVGIPLIEG
jgi:long-chain acyl-CoA synthetase